MRWMSVLVILLVVFPVCSGAELQVDPLDNLASPDPEVRSDACLAMAAAGIGADSLLVARLADDSLLVRHCAAYALARRGGPVAEKAFRQGLQSPDYDRRRVSALGLGMLGASRSLEALQPLLADRSWEVRWAAAYALGRGGDRQALPALKRLAAGDPYRDNQGAYPVREAAIASVSRLEAAVGWRRDLSAAGKEGRARRRPLVVYLRQAGELCSQYERVVFSDERVADALQRVVPVWLDRGTSPADFELFRVQRLPALVCLEPGGRVISRDYGVLSPNLLQKRVLDALEGEPNPGLLRRRLADDPADLESAWQLVEAYLEEGRLDGADSLCGEIIGCDPDNVSSLLDNAVFTKAYILGCRGNFPASASALQAMLDRFAFSGERARALYCLGLARYKSGSPEEGRKALQRLIRDYPSSRLGAAAAGFLAKSPGR